MFFFQNVTLSHGTFKLRSRPQIRKFISTIILITLSDIKSGYFQGLCLSIFVFLSKELIFTGFRRVCILHGENCGRKVQDDRNGIRTRKFCFFCVSFAKQIDSHTIRKIIPPIKNWMEEQTSLIKSMSFAICSRLNFINHEHLHYFLPHIIQ